MRSSSLVIVLLFALGWCPTQALASPTAPEPWFGLGPNLGDAFTGENALLHIGGVLATLGMSSSGADYEVHRFSREHMELSPLGIPGLLLGFAAPFAVVGSLYAAGWLGDDPSALGAGAAVLQASVLVFTYHVLLKLITGRMHPPEPDEWTSSADARRQSRHFRFGFGRGGVFEGWPSGHTAIVTAVGVTLATYYDATWLHVLAYASIAYVAFSMVAFEGGVHWASDTVAAFLLSYPIATSVGARFRDGTQAVRATPHIERGGVGLQWIGTF